MTLLLVLGSAVLAFSARFYNQALVDRFFAFALTSVVITHLRIQPKWPDVLLVIAIALALGEKLVREGPNKSPPALDVTLAGQNLSISAT